MHEKLHQANRIVIKLGTQILVQEDGSLAYARLAALVEECAALVALGKSILIVSSGAVGLGRQALKLGHAPLSLSQKQACAAVGQNLLMDIYRELFSRYQLVTAQLLLTSLDFEDRQRYLNLRDTLETLLDYRVVPIINENDTVSTAELKENQTSSFGDNDKLSAIVAGKLGADLLIILTNVDGIYTENPSLNPNAEKLRLIEGFEPLKAIETNGKSTMGRGGMASKIEAAKMAAISGVHTLITSGTQPNVLHRIFNPDNTDVGTLILAQGGMSGKKRWLGLASGYSGVIVINDGAKAALINRHASLLPSGITQVQGDFQARQVVSIQTPEGDEIGRGLANFSAEDTRKIQGLQSREIPGILPAAESDEVIHRDNLVIYQDYLEPLS